MTLQLWATYQDGTRFEMSGTGDDIERTLRWFNSRAHAGGSRPRLRVLGRRGTGGDVVSRYEAKLVPLHSDTTTRLVSRYSPADTVYTTPDGSRWWNPLDTAYWQVSPSVRIARHGSGFYSVDVIDRTRSDAGYTVWRPWVAGEVYGDEVTAIQDARVAVADCHETWGTL